MTRAQHSSLNRLTWTIALVLALLFTQFAGQQHRIAHAGWQGSAGIPGLTHAQHDSDQDKNHSCLTFDAATLAHAAGTALAAMPVVAGTHMPAQWLAYISWDAPVVHLFLSRAPPASHSSAI